MHAPQLVLLYCLSPSYLCDKSDPIRTKTQTGSTVDPLLSRLTPFQRREWEVFFEDRSPHKRSKRLTTKRPPISLRHEFE